jgi:hypothetical protein
MDFRTTVIKTLLGEQIEKINLNENDSNSLPAHLQKDYQKRDGRIIPKIHPTLSAHDHGYEYTHGTSEDAQSKGEIIRNHKECKLDNPHPKGSKEHIQFNAGADKAKADALKDWH